MKPGHSSALWRVSYVQLFAGQSGKRHGSGKELCRHAVVQQRQNL